MTTPILILAVIGVAWVAWMAWVVRECSRRQRLLPLGRAIVYHGLTFGAVIMGLPFYWMLITSVKTFHDAQAYPPRWVPLRTVCTLDSDAEGTIYEVIKGDPRGGILGGYAYVLVKTEQHPNGEIRGQIKPPSSLNLDSREPVTFKIALNARQADKQKESEGEGRGTITIDPTSNTLTYDMSFRNLSSAITGVSIHGYSKTKRAAPELLKLAHTDGKASGIVTYTAAQEWGELVLLPKVMPAEQIIRSTTVLPSQVSNVKRELYFKIGNYAEAWVAPKVTTFGQYFWVSIFTAVTTTIGTLLTGALAAFAFAKMRFRGKGAFFYIILMTMMVPGQVLLIPSYIILQYLGWLDTYLALIVPWLASVFTIFLMRQFFMTIPDDLWDAAQIDGSSRFRFLFIVVLPLSKPVMITAGIFTFLGNWNSLLWPLIVTTRPEMRTIMVGLQTYNTEAGGEFHLLMAASTMAILPIVVAFFFLQKFFIAGIARTGLK